jgi:hypothetical protein
MMVNKRWSHQRHLIQLDGLASLAKPNYLRLPERLKELTTVRYDCRKFGEDRIQFKDIKYLPVEDFLAFTSQRNSTASNVYTITDFGGTKLLIANDVAPSYYTSFDDDYIVFDAYDAAVDDTVHSAKTQCLAYILPLWETEDGAIPDLPAEAFPALLEEAKATASMVIKQVANPKAEQQATRQNRWLSRNSWRTNKEYQYPDYGRK